MKEMFATVLAVLVAGMLLFPPAGALAGGSDAGKAIYDANCKICHGADGNGKGPASMSLTPPPADFRSPAFWKNQTDVKIADVIKHGKKMMPSFDLPPDQVQQVIDYITGTFKPSGSSGAPEKAPK